MKRHGQIITLMFFLAMVLSLFAACDAASGSSKLSSPINLEIDGTTLTWDAVENASGYIVRFEDTGHETEQARYDLSSLTEPGTYIIDVMAAGDGVNYTDSDWSQGKEYTIEPEAEQSLEFEFYTTSSYEVTGIGTVTSDEIVVPATYNGLPVKSIGFRAFENNVKLKSVVLPDGIFMIKNYAFSGCTSLESITLPNGLYSIQRHAFSGTALKTLDLPDSAESIPYPIIDNCLELESIRLPGKLRTIFSDFFYNTPKLKSVTLPESLDYIGDYAFVGSSIESIKFHKYVKIICESAFENSIIHSVEFEKDSQLTKIGQNAFRGCNNLESILLPASVTEIGQDAFSDCANLKSVAFEKNAQITTLVGHPFRNLKITTFTVPKSITTLGFEMFSDLPALETVTFEDDSEITFLAFKLFYNCPNLTAVDFGKNSKIDTVSYHAFEDCPKLRSLHLPQTVTTICDNAFSNDIALEGITIPSGVATMGSNVFSGWTEDQQIYIEGRTEAPEGWAADWYAQSNATIHWNEQPVSA